MKKPIFNRFALLLALILLTTVFPPMEARAENPPIQVMIDGELLEFDVPPQMVNNRVLVPVRFVFEALGAEVEWDGDTQTAKAHTLDGLTLTLVIGSTTLMVNGTAQEMDVPAKVIDGRTLAPLRFVAEAMGNTADWDAETWTAIIESGPRTLAARDMQQSLACAGDIAVYAFQLEEGELVNFVGNPVPAPMDGILALPHGPGPHPLVVLLHGVTFIDSIHDPVYAGFDYLVQQMAAEGFVALSFNINVEFSWDYGESLWGEWAYSLFNQHLDRLLKAAQGEDMGHGPDLTDKIDFNQIHLIGHSRGGELADIFVRRDLAAGLTGDTARIRSIIRVAPTVLPYHEPGDLLHPDLPVGIILPEFDGDVPHDGQVVFDEVLEARQNESFLSLVYLRGANHNYFNRFFQLDDGTMEENRLTREQQEDFLMRYAVAFLAQVLENAPPHGLFDPSRPQPVSMFGYPVIASTYLPGTQSILRTPAETALATDVSATGDATAAFYLQTWDADGLFTHPAVSLRQDPSLPLYDLQWTGEGAVSFALLTEDFSRHQALSLYLATDSSNEKNPQGEPQALSLTLRDQAGREQSVRIPPGTSALTWHPGFVSTWWDIDIWEGFMPLGELRLPLTYFSGLDLTSIAELTISFDQSPSGAIMLSGIYLK